MGCVHTQLLPPLNTAGEHKPTHPPYPRHCFWLETTGLWSFQLLDGEPQNPPYSYCPGLERWYEVENEVRILRMPQGLTKQWYDQRSAYSWPSKDIFSKPLWMPRLIEHWGIQRRYSDIRPLKRFYWCHLPRSTSEKRLHVNMFCLICTKAEQALTGTSINKDDNGARLL